jgi:hypothetical protein
VTELEALAKAKRFTEIARMLAEGEPPGWVAPLLWHQGRLISRPRPGPLDEDNEKRLIKKARDLAEALSSYEKLVAEVEDRHAFPVHEVHQ